MIKFEQIKEEEELPVEGKPYKDKQGNMNITLKSSVKCVYNEKLDNQNHEISAELAEIIKENNLFVCKRILDYCPGYGSIGLDMLSLGTTNHVVFADTVQETVVCSLENAKLNSILFYTTGYCIDTISDLPESEKYDVVVATISNDKEKYVDFFMHIHNYLSLYADIFLVESKDDASLKNSNKLLLNKIYFVKSFPLGNKMIMHYKLSHDHLVK
jgi:16S rRNA G1207 methylase RsmC